MTTKHQPCTTAIPNWRESYRIALFETDRQKLPSRIDEAEKAIRLRATELSAADGDYGEEAQAVEGALYALRALRNSFELKTHEPPTA